MQDTKAWDKFKEKINQLQTYKLFQNDKETYLSKQDVIDLVSEIEREVKKMNDDLISRQAALDDAHSQIWYRLNPNMKERIDTWLVNLPAVQPEQKTGYWIGEELGECSSCGHSGCASDIWNGCEQMFCPNCGAKMEVDENDH